jgi:hypothetical protein
VHVLIFTRRPELNQAVLDLPGLSAQEVGGLFVVLLAPDATGERDGEREREREATWSEFVIASEKDPSFVTGEMVLGMLRFVRRGLFGFQAHDDRFNIPEPYGRVLVPREPARITDFPASIRSHLEALPRLGVSFAKLTHVQPAEHLPCATWGSVIYLATDGVTVRALHGENEREFNEQAGALKDNPAMYRPLVIEPPEADSTPQSAPPPQSDRKDAEPPSSAPASRDWALWIGAALALALIIALALGVR